MRVYMDGCFDLAHFGHANALRQARHIGEKEDDAFNTKDDEDEDYEKDGKNATTRTTRTTTTTCELVVGIVSDAEIARCKGPPVVPEEERVKCVKAVKWVDDVITNVPYELTPEFVERLFSGTHFAGRRFCTSLLFSIFLSFSHSLYVSLFTPADEYGIDCIVHGDDPCYLPDGTDAYAIPKTLGKYREIKRTEGVSTTDLVARLLEFADSSDGGKDTTKSSSDGNSKRHESRFCTTASRIAQFAAKVSYSKTSKIHTEDKQRKRKGKEEKRKNGNAKDNDTCCYVVGAFDVFNAGHVELLEECSVAADKVICAVIADEYLTSDQTNQPPPMLNQSERAMSAIACRHCDDVVVGAPARITDDICKTFNVTAVVFEDDASITAQDRKVCEKNGVEILSVQEKHFSRKKITIAKRVQANRALFEARQKRKMASEAAYYEQKSFVAEE
jgi:ethanolamine-phosphate cytidylyltransferase